MKIDFQYDGGVLTLPDSVLLALDSASGEDLQVLLLLAAGTAGSGEGTAASAATGTDVTAGGLAASADMSPATNETFASLFGEDIMEESFAAWIGCTPARVRRALRFWEDAGVITVTSDGDHAASNSGTTDNGAAKGKTVSGSGIPKAGGIAGASAGNPMKDSASSPPGHPTGAAAGTQPGTDNTGRVSGTTGTARTPETVRLSDTAGIRGTDSTASGAETVPGTAPGTDAGNPSVSTAGTKNGEGSAAPQTVLRRAEELPNYTTKELAALLERRRGLALLLEECQRAWGKVFNTHEANIVIGLIEYLGFDGEYTLLLLNHCTKMNLRSLHSVERLAYRMHDDGILSAGALQERLCRMEAAHTAEGMIRSMFGMGSRSFTEKEKEQIDLWINTYRFGEDIIRRAYEITVNVKSKPSISYAGGILRRWYEAGYRTVEEIDREQRERRAENAAGLGSAAGAGDDFWEAAVRASYGSDYARLGFTSSSSGSENSGNSGDSKKGSDKET